MKVIVTGMIGSYPIGGVVWDYAQYALGLERLGFEVYYLEDTGWQSYNPLVGEYGDDCSYAVAFLQQSLAQLSPALGRRWRFRNIDGQTFGLSDENFKEVLNSADLFLNVSGGTLLREEYMICKRKVLIDTDPGWNHFRNYPRWDASPQWQGTHGYRAHDSFFTYAERIGQPDCILPDMNLTWKPTRPLVVMEQWKAEPRNDTWTTVLTWKNFQETITYDGVVYGTKEMEFPEVISIPTRVDARFEVAIGGEATPRAEWEALGWSVVPASCVSSSLEQYRHYVQQSRGEFSVAKQVYVATRSGWFSCRSVCYLAAGLPVVVQDTGFSELIPTGEGLFAFSRLADAVSAIERVEEDYAKHQRAAKTLAAEFFDSDVVLADLLSKAGL